MNKGMIIVVVAVVTVAGMVLYWSIMQLVENQDLRHFVDFLNGSLLFFMLLGAVLVAGDVWWRHRNRGDQR